MRKKLPTGPIVSNANGTVSSNRTYQDLLKIQRDELNFENIVTAELYKVNLNGTQSLFKEANMYAGETFHDGNYIMISTIEKPFSYIVPNRFQNHCSIRGKKIKVVNEVALNEIIPKGFMATRTGKEIWDGETTKQLRYTMWKH
jgi:hypothetical protein